MRSILARASLLPLLSLVAMAVPAQAQNRGDWNGGWSGGWNGNQRTRLRCESWNYREATCVAPAPIDSVRLVRVIAGDCRDGATWRWDRRAIQVRGGCRAYFEMLSATQPWAGGGQWGGGGSMTCESWNYRAASCPVPGARGVRLARVLGGECIEGRSWRFDRGQIMVRDGCRARFDLY